MSDRVSETTSSWSRNVSLFTSPSPPPPTTTLSPIPQQSSSSTVTPTKATMPSRKNLPQHPLAVVYPNVGNLNASKFGMTPKDWNRLDEEKRAPLHKMIEDAESFRHLHDNPEGYEPSDLYQTLATLLRNLVRNKVWYTELWGPEKTQANVMKVIKWFHKRENEVAILIEAFTTTHGVPSTPLETFIAHGYTPFLASRIRFLAAFERVYSTDPPLSYSIRILKPEESFFAQYDILHMTHLQTLPPKDQKSKAFFSLTLLDIRTWDLRYPERLYNFHIPPISLDEEIHYTHSVMVSHGITLFAAVLSYGKNPIDLENAQVKHIEKTMNLCIKATEQYWAYILAVPPQEGHLRWDPTNRHLGGKNEKEWLRKYMLENIGVCDVVRRDLGRARSLVGN